MINIALCDDDRNVISELSEYIERKYPPKEKKVRLYTFAGGQELLNAMEKETCFHILILDIQMDGPNGVDIGTAVRKRADGELYRIIYISMYYSYDSKLGKIGYARLLRKPIDYLELDKQLEKSIALVQKYLRSYHTPGLFRYKVKTDDRSVLLNDIAYIRSSHRQVMLFLMKESQLVDGDVFYAKLEDIQKTLPQKFLRCERSYIVNLRHVDQYYADHFIMADDKGTCIPISRGYQPYAKLEYFEYQEY